MYKVLTRAKTWMSLNNIMVSKRKETQKSMYYVISFVGKTIVTECRSMGVTAQGQARGLTPLGGLTPSSE